MYEIITEYNKKWCYIMLKNLILASAEMTSPVEHSQFLPINVNMFIF